MATLRIAWHDYNIGEDGFNIYRSDTPMDVTAMPSPIASVGPNVGAYTDSTVVGGNEYYYRIGVTRNGEEVIGDEQKLFAGNVLTLMGARDGRVIALDFYKNQIEKGIWPYDKGIDDYVNHTAIGPDGYFYVAFGYNDNRLIKIDLSNGNEVWSTALNRGADTFVFDNNGYMYTGAKDDKLRKIDITDGTEITSNGWPYTHTADIYGLGIDSNNNFYIGGNSGPITKVDSTGNEVTSGSWPIQNPIYYISDIIVDSNDNVYVFGNTDYNSGNYSTALIKYDVNGNDSWSFTGHTDSVSKIAISPSEDYIYTTSDDNTTRKIDASNGNEITSGNWRLSNITAKDIATDIMGNIYLNIGYQKLRKYDSNLNEIWTYETDDSTIIHSFSVNVDY